MVSVGCDNHAYWFGPMLIYFIWCYTHQKNLFFIKELININFCWCSHEIFSSKPTNNLYLNSNFCCYNESTIVKDLHLGPCRRIAYSKYSLTMISFFGSIFLYKLFNSGDTTKNFYVDHTHTYRNSVSFILIEK